MATEDSKAATGPEKMEDDAIASKDGKDKDRMSTNNSESNEPASTEIENSNLVSKEKLNSLTSRLQLLEKRLMGGVVEESKTEEIAKAPQSIIKAFNLTEADTKANSDSKQSENKISVDDSQPKSCEKEEQKLDDGDSKSDHIEEKYSSELSNCKQDSEEKMDVDVKEADDKTDVKISEESSEKESDKSCTEQKFSAETKPAGDPMDVDKDSESKEAIDRPSENISDTKAETDNVSKDDEKVHPKSKESSVESPGGESAPSDHKIKEEEKSPKTELKPAEGSPKTQVKSEEGSPKTESNPEKLIPEIESKSEEQSQKMKSNSNEAKSAENAVDMVKSETSSTEVTEDCNTGDKSADDAEQTSKSDPKDVSAPKKGRGIDAIASMLRKHQVLKPNEVTEIDKPSEPKDESPKSEIQGFFADTMNEFLGMYGYDKENQKEDTSLPTEKIPEPAIEPAETSNVPKPAPEPEPKDNKSVGSKRLKTCEECKEVKVCKYEVMMQGADKFIRTHICDDKCYTTYRGKQKQQRDSARRVTRSHTKEVCNICSKDIRNSSSLIPSYGESKLTLCTEACYKKFKQREGPERKCSQCKKPMEGRTKYLTWETMEYCSEDCLGSYQNVLGSHCACCNTAVQNASLGKFCVRFGSDIKQFCSNTCLEEFKQGLKVCTFCQKDISDGFDGFLAPVGDKGQFKEFCSQNCMEKYDVMNNINGSAPKMNHCTVCHKLKAIKIELDYEETTHEICSELCYTAFKFASKIKQHKCSHCHKLFELDDKTDDQGQFTVQMDGVGKRFCTKMCLNIFVLSNRKIVPCSWCKVKKYNFDMIERTDGSISNHVQLFCSLKCLSLFKAGPAPSSRTVKCDFCSKNAAAQYHLTMSDATVRNFCCYTCVAKFRNQYPSDNFQKVSATNQVHVNKGTTILKSSSPSTSTASSPNAIRIQNSNLNRQGTSTSIIKTVTTPSMSKMPINRPANSPRPPTASGGAPVVIVKPPQPKMLKNKGTMCKPIMVTKGVACRPNQSGEDSDGKTKYIPFPLPIYVPMPMHMYSMPTPVVLPIPIPIPVPVFIPTTKDSAEAIITSIKEIKEKADAISSTTRSLRAKRCQKGAASKHKESDEDEQTYSSNDEADESGSQDEVEENGETCSSPDSRVRSAVKRPASNGSHNSIKRRRIPSASETHVKSDKPISNHDSPTPKSSMTIDLSGNLKYMYGVNAWKNWVINKNQQLEKASQSNRKLKLFKTDILQLTSDELNYSLCLFVKEVRNPSGEEYEADRIYYLCLGIQQYLFLNNRIDNILTDANFEKFTECLNDALSTYELKQQVATGKFMARVNAEILWESRQLGAHSPHVLLNTLLYFNTKYFGLKTVDDHMKMSFSQVIKTWKKSGKSNPSCLRYHLSAQAASQQARGLKRKKDVLEQVENLDNPLRCPVKLYEFYLVKCPEAVKTRNDVYYLYPERSCVPDSRVWYSMQPLGKDQLNKMLQRAKMIQGAFTHI